MKEVCRVKVGIGSRLPTLEPGAFSLRQTLLKVGNLATIRNAPPVFCKGQKSLHCNMNWQDYIVSDDQVLLGKPIIKGTRISEELIMGLLSSGWNEKQILESYHTLSETSLRAVFTYLKACMQQELDFPISA